ncbi:MAG: hypothetical protein HY562_04165 [Ignavibacteriales bacterium]|nr:hypothetical protein [Ignavibacteriales bacterium]
MDQMHKSIFLRSPTLATIFATACLGLISCGATVGGSSPSYELAHNADRTLIMGETSQVLPLYNFVVESSDERRDRGALQTFWRTNYGVAVNADSSLEISIRDRVFLHFSPRGKSSIQYNVYQMVNASLQFEIQLKQGETWVDIEPVKEYDAQYRAIVRDIRNRMLRYLKEF